MSSRKRLDPDAKSESGPPSSTKAQLDLQLLSSSFYSHIGPVLKCKCTKKCTAFGQDTHSYCMVLSLFLKLQKDELHALHRSQSRSNTESWRNFLIHFTLKMTLNAVRTGDTH